MKRSWNEIDYWGGNWRSWKAIKRYWNWEGARGEMIMKWNIKVRIKAKEFESWVWSS